MSGGGIGTVVTMKVNKTRKSLQLKTRNWRAVAAHFRSSAGPIKDQRKEKSKTFCRGMHKRQDNE